MAHSCEMSIYADHLLGEKPPLQAVLADKPVSPQDFESQTLCGVITGT